MTPNPHYNFRVGVSSDGSWKEIFNSDEKRFWGSGIANHHPVKSETVNWHGRENSISVTIPPLAAVMFKRV